MTDTPVLAPAAAFFLLGLVRGLSTCLFLCAPGMIPIIVNEKAGLRRSLWLGFLLSLPRLVFLTALGAILGFVSFSVVNSGPARGAVIGINVGAYMLLGLLLVFVGGRLLGTYGAGGTYPAAGAGGRGPNERRRGSRGKARGTKHESGRKGKGAGRECREPKGTFWARLWTGLARRLYPKKGRSEALFLLWGGVLGLACLAEVGLLEGAAASALAGSESAGAALSAGFGALMMFLFSIGATVPILVAAAVGGELVEKVRDRKRLELIRGASAMLMVLLGLYFVFREIYYVLVATGVY